MDERAASKHRAMLEVLSCTALTPELWTVLVFDVDPPAFDWLATATADVLAAATGTEVDEVRLGPAATEDTLWSKPKLRHEHGELRLGSQEGALAPAVAGPATRLVVIPDLTRMSLAATRAVVALAGAEVAHVERHGLHRTWQPKLFWLAACGTEVLGRVTPHLLDRFAVRIDGREFSSKLGRAVNIFERWSSHRASDSWPNAVPAEVASRLRAARIHHPAVGWEVADHALAQFEPTVVQGIRRPLALARLARAYARMAGASAVTPQHVDRAARMIGLYGATAAADQEPADAAREPTTPASTVEQNQPVPQAFDEWFDRESAWPLEVGGLADEELGTVPVLEPGPAEALEVASLSDKVMERAPGSPYREDEVEAQREPGSLRLPWPSRSEVTSGRGVIVGVQRAASLRDLAVVETLFEAAKFQSIRRRHKPEPTSRTRLLLSPRDLRSYYRSAEPEQMLALLLDHTCRGKWEWQESLWPYLRWAYISRAKVCLVQVGSATAPAPLQAERTMARNVLDPRVRAALDARPGTATPLAHGLDLVIRTLQHAMQHGNQTIRRSWMVVVTDGRGNVPLEVSRAGVDRSLFAKGATPQFGRRGVDDALEVAQRLRSLRRVQKVVIDPAPSPYPDLPSTFAEALGAVLVNGQTPEASFEGVGHAD